MTQPPTLDKEVELLWKEVETLTYIATVAIGLIFVFLIFS